MSLQDTKIALLHEALYELIRLCSFTIDRGDTLDYEAKVAKISLERLLLRLDRILKPQKSKGA